MFSYQKSFVNPTLPVDEAQFWALVRATKWAENIDKFRETGDAQLKRKLPAFIFQATFDETTSKSGKVGTWRKQAATRLTGLVVMDVDHVEDPLEVFNGRWKIENGKLVAREEWAAENHCQLSIINSQLERILLIYITPSGKGLKIVFKADVQKGNLIDNQHAMAKVLGVEVDESCKDASRMSFICKESDILYLDKELFTYENKEFGERYDKEYRDGHSQGSTQKGRFFLCTPTSAEEKSTQKEPSLLCTNSQLEWKGYDVQSIIDLRYGDKLPCAADSNRHNESLKLASDLLIMFDGDKQKTLQVLKAQPWVQEIIDERNENVEQTVESAAQRMTERERKYGPDLRLSKAMQEAIESTRRAHPSPFPSVARLPVAFPEGRDVDVLKGDSSGNQTSPPSEGLGEAVMDCCLCEWGREIESLFDVFPCLREACQGMKPGGYPAALFTSAAFFGTLMTRTTWHHWFEPDVVRRLNYSVMIIGDPASGKSFATRLYRLIADPIKVADKAGYDAVNRWKDDKGAKGANKEKPKKPQVVIRDHPARTANGVFITDMVNAVEVVDGEPMNLHMLTFDSELDNATLMAKGGQWIDKSAMELKAFHNEEDGQAYANLDSISGKFYVYWNFVYTGTPLSLDRKVSERNFGTGLATRLAVIPMPERNFQLAGYGAKRKVDHAADETLKTWAYRLDGVKGELPIEKLVRATYDWQSAKMEVAAYDRDKAMDMLLMRVPYYGIGIAAPYVVMRHWDEWQEHHTLTLDEQDVRLCRLAMDIQFACQQYFFYAYAQAYFDNMKRDRHEKRRTNRSKYDEAYKQLPQEFSLADIERCYGVTNKNAKNAVKRLLDSGFVERVKHGKYKKLKQTVI